MIALFLGELYALNAARRSLLVLAGFGLSFLFNLRRMSLLVLVAGARRGGDRVVARTRRRPILVACFLTLWLAAGVAAREKQNAARRKSINWKT